MDLSFLSDYYIPVVLVACLVVGYCIKHITWLDKIAETVVYGAFTGLASTGLHQAFTQIISKNNRSNQEG